MLIFRKNAWGGNVIKHKLYVSMSIFDLILERLDDVPLYFHASRVFLDMHELEMMNHRCSKRKARAIISRSYQDRMTLDMENIQISCHAKNGKMLIELHHALEYILSQFGQITAVMHHALLELEIALDTAVNDVDLFDQIVEYLLKGRVFSRKKPKKWSFAWICKVNNKKRKKKKRRLRSRGSFQ